MTQQDPVATPRPAPTAVTGSFIADPGPLGLAAFAATTFFLTSIRAGILPSAGEAGVLGLAFFYGGLAQAVAGIVEFFKGNTFGAVAFVSYGAFWLSFWYLATSGVPALIAAKATVNDINDAVGTFLLVWTVFTVYMTVAAVRTSAAVFAVFAALALTFLFLTIGAYSGDADGHGATRIGGYLGLLTAILAWYASFAAVTNSTFKRVVLPVFPR